MPAAALPPGPLPRRRGEERKLLLLLFEQQLVELLDLGQRFHFVELVLLEQQLVILVVQRLRRRRAPLTPL